MTSDRLQALFDLAEAWWELRRATIHLPSIHFERVERTGKLPDAGVAEALAAAQKTFRAVARASRLGQRRATCLGRAVAMHAILARRGVPAMIGIGTRGQADPGGFAAHAWVEVAGVRLGAGAGSAGAVIPFAQALVPSLARSRIA